MFTCVHVNTVLGLNCTLQDVLSQTWAVVCIAVPGLGVIPGTVHSTIIRPITRTIARLVSTATTLTAVIPDRPWIPDPVNLNKQTWRYVFLFQFRVNKVLDGNLTWTWEIVATARILIFTLA